MEEIRKDLAIVNRMENLYVFTDSTPVTEYEYLGTVKVSVVWSGQYQNVRNSLIKKAKKKYPQAEGIILHMKAGGTDRADVIMFKH